MSPNSVSSEPAASQRQGLITVAPTISTNWRETLRNATSTLFCRVVNDSHLGRTEVPRGGALQSAEFAMP